MFCTPEGLHEFNVMPFGLCNAPAIDGSSVERPTVEGLLGVPCDVIVLERCLKITSNT